MSLTVVWSEGDAGRQAECYFPDVRQAMRDDSRAHSATPRLHRADTPVKPHMAGTTDKRSTLRRYWALGLNFRAPLSQNFPSMVHNAERRSSTGGLPPIKVRKRYVVEEAPSHGGTPCFTAWARQEIAEIPQGWSASDFTIADVRPQWSLQIYDTTPHAASPEHLRKLAVMLHTETREEREGGGRGRPDRFDVWGMPCAEDASDVESLAKCKAHLLAAIAARESSGENGFHVPELHGHYQWMRARLIIDRPQGDWDESEGGFLEVHWGLQPEYLAMLAQEYGGDHQEPDTSVSRHTRDEIGQLLCILRSFF